MEDYWCTTSLFDGNYARTMIPSHKRFKALLSFRKVVDSANEDPNDRLRKVRYLYDHMRDTCNALFKLGQFISVDERIKSKGRFLLKQYLPKKPVKWGFKVFVACGAQTSVLFNFDIYTGKDAADDEGLTRAVVHCLTADLAAGQNVVLFTDNFYTSSTLAKRMLARGIYLTGTLRLNRRGVPEEFKCDGKAFEKRSERGATRYIRKNDILYQKWKDQRCVSMLSTIHRGNDHFMVTRNAKVNGAHRQCIRQPKCIRNYNQKMGGVNCFDQHVAAYRVL